MSISSEQLVTLSEALETYVTQKGAGKPKSFEAAAQRACTYLVDACGAKTLAEYTRADALRYRDHLIAKGLVGSSVSRVISSIRAVFNFAIFEYALDLKNPFVGMYFDKLAGVSKRLPIPIDDIRKVLSGWKWTLTPLATGSQQVLKTTLGSLDAIQNSVFSV